MASKSPRTVPLRRKREKKTNYKKRLHLLLSKKPRLVVRFTNTRVIAQVVTFTTTGDKVVAGVDSTQLAKQGWGYSLKNYPAAYLTGVLIGKASVAAGINEAVLDTGFVSPKRGGKMYALLKGALDAGLVIAHKETIFPSEERVRGDHIATHNTKAGKMPQDFDALKQKLLG